MADISKITLPGGSEAYNLKDASARADIVTINSTLAGKVNKSGDTMTGALTLSGAPTENLHASTKKYVDDAVAGVSGGLVFKGTLGTGGTISVLPTAAAANKGHMYKVITDGTYAGIAAKVGDLFISDGNAWVHIPSGDEPSGTVTNVATGTGLTGGPITTSGTIAIDTTVVAQKGDRTGKTDSATTGISINAHSATGTFSNGTTTAAGSNAASAVSFGGTTKTASKVVSEGSVAPGSAASIGDGFYTAGSVTAGSAAALKTGFYTPGSVTDGSSAVYGTDSFTPAAIQAGFYSAGSVSAGSAASFGATVTGETLSLSWTPDVPTAVTLPTIDTTKFSGGSYSHTGFNGGSATIVTLPSIDTTKFDGGSATQVTMATIDTSKFDGGAPTDVTLPTFSDVTNLVATDTTNAVAAAQDFTGAASAVTGTVSVTIDDHTITDGGHKHDITLAI